MNIKGIKYSSPAGVSIDQGLSKPIEIMIDHLQMFRDVLRDMHGHWNSYQYHKVHPRSFLTNGKGKDDNGARFVSFPKVKVCAENLHSSAIT